MAVSHQTFGELYKAKAIFEADLESASTPSWLTQRHTMWRSARTIRLILTLPFRPAHSPSACSQSLTRSLDQSVRRSGPPSCCRGQ